MKRETRTTPTYGVGQIRGSALNWFLALLMLAAVIAVQLSGSPLAFLWLASAGVVIAGFIHGMRWNRPGSTVLVTTPRGACYRAVLRSGVASGLVMGLMCASVWCAQFSSWFASGGTVGSPDAVGVIGLVLVFLAMAAAVPAVMVFLSNRPKWLVPPRFRDEPGYFQEVRISRGTDRIP